MPLTEAGAAVIGAGLTLAGSGAQAIGSVVKNRKSYKYTQKLMDKQQAINLQNWNLQNAYNSPSAQMVRLRAAGLNPNLIYQNGGSFAGAGELASPSINQFDYQDPISSAVQGAYQGAMFMPNYNSVQVATENTKSAKALTDLSKALGEKDLNWRDRMLYQQYIGLQMKNLVDQATANNLESNTGLTKRQIDSFYLNLQNTLDNDRVQRMLNNDTRRQINSTIDQINSAISKTDNESSLLRLEYARGMIAYQLENAAARFKLSSDAKYINDYLQTELTKIQRETEAAGRGWNVAGQFIDLNDVKGSIRGAWSKAKYLWHNQHHIFDNTRFDQRK